MYIPSMQKTVVIDFKTPSNPKDPSAQGFRALEFLRFRA